MNTFKIDSNNLLLFLILIISNPQFTIYHKYLDPLLIILFFLFFLILNLKKEEIINKKFLVSIYLFYIVPVIN